ncbi:MAG: hypothetical protein Q9160_002180 [Pyrenula sp. 1 TL-2023]
MSRENETIQSVNELLRRRVQDHPNEIVVTVPDQHFNYSTYTFSQLDQAVSKLAWHLTTKPWVSTALLSGQAPVVGFLSKSGFHYATHTLALSRLGWTILFLSPNNSPAALEHLLRRTKCSTILVQPDLAKLASQAKALIDQSGNANVSVESFSDSSVWEAQSSVESCPAKFGEQAESDHAHGHSSLFRSLYSVKNICLYPPELPITATNVIRALQDTSAEVFYAVPFVLKLLAESKQGIEALTALKLVMFGGSACPDGLGNVLTGKGVSLLSHYGMTEVGQLMTSQRDFENDKGWDWVRAGDAVRPYLRFEERSEETYELIVLSGWKSKVMSNQADGSYASKDLFSKHPTIPNAYKFMGRIDDTLTLYNGEKTNPIRYENILRESRLVKDAIVFGDGQVECGVLILPAEPVELLHSFMVNLEQILKKANSQAESHAQISRDMVRVLSQDTVLPRTDKGTLLRPAVYRDLKAEIEKMYEKGRNTMALKKFDTLELKIFLRQLVLDALPGVEENLQDESDLFSLGLDSLKSMKMRNSIISRVDVDGRPISINVVYEHATIESLARFLVSLQEGVVEKEDENAKMLKLVEKYSDFERFAKVASTMANGGLTHHTEAQKQDPGVDGYSNVQVSTGHGEMNGCQSKTTVVALTGASGSLGAHLLASFLSSPNVSQVYCLVRASTDSQAFDKVKNSLRLRKLSTFSSDPRITCLATALGKPLLGLDENTYREVASRVTSVVHDGWAVNFSLGVESFEADCISGLRNLLQLCLSSAEDPASFYFVSSISATAGPAAPSLVLEQHYADPHVAQEMGYARSKWVGEWIVEHACQVVPSLNASVLRLGQLVGDQQHGVWNTSEAISLMIKSGDVIGALPNLGGETVCWLPVNTAAAFCVEVVLGDRNKPASGEVWNVVNPKTTPWQDILKFLKEAGLDFNVVETSTWIETLEKSEKLDGPERNPAVKLIGFWKAKYCNKGGALNEENIGKASEPLQPGARTWATHVKPQSVDSALIRRFVEAWRDERFLKMNGNIKGIDQRFPEEPM